MILCHGEVFFGDKENFAVSSSGSGPAKPISRFRVRVRVQTNFAVPCGSGSGFGFGSASLDMTLHKCEEYILSFNYKIWGTRNLSL